MGLASSAEAELASVAIRVTGTVYATAAFMDGSAVWAVVLLAIAHFVILYPLGIPPITNNTELIGYFVTWPLIGVLYALLAWLAFWLLDLGELMPWKRYAGGVVRGNYGARPSGVAIILNTIWWLLIAVGSASLFELFVFSIPWLAVVLAVGIPVLLWLILWAVYRFMYNQPNLFGAQSNVNRSILFPMFMHVITNLTLGLIVVLQTSDTYNWAWIGSLVLAGVILIVTIAYYFFGHSAWDAQPALSRPPRTGDMAPYLGKNVTSAAASTLPQAQAPASDVIEPLIEPENSNMRARMGGLAYHTRMATGASVLGQASDKML